MRETPLLRVRGLRTSFLTEAGETRAVAGVDLTLTAGETLGLVGESGCGKSVTCLSLMQLVPYPGRILGGEVWFRGRDLRRLGPGEMSRVRGREMAMVFQDPMTALDPLFTVGDQIAEPVRRHLGLRRNAALDRAVELLSLVGFPSPRKRLADFPHQLSGGMRQRVVLAIALACEPAVLIADEPTTALDVTVQAQILDILRRLQDRFGMAIILVTHDLGVVAELASRVAVMYAGRIVEEASVRELFARPLHPYSRGLLGCLTPLDYDLAEELPVIPGSVPDLLDLPAGCAFQDRCPIADDRTRAEMPQLEEVLPGHFVRCFNWKQEDLAGSFRA